VIRAARARPDQPDPHHHRLGHGDRLIYPELAGKLNGHAVRVPLLNASLTDCVFEMARETSVEEINAAVRRLRRRRPEGHPGL
jgi:glyceraldehyde-3-phosphate dehydrogenase/erythrose-4-phosphate dehydrogenase